MGASHSGTITRGRMRVTSRSVKIRPAALLRPPVSVLIFLALMAALAAVAFSRHGAAPTPPAVAPLVDAGLHVRGNAIVDRSDQVIHLHGVSRAGTEYACSQGWGIFDGPNDEQSVQAMLAWDVNSVRVPLNEDCWLGINGVKPAYGGLNYQRAIRQYVQLLEHNGLVPILDLHIAAPGTTLANYPTQPMPDEDHSVAFWRQVAGAYKGDTTVIFDLFNEPFPDSNQGTVAAWRCWRDGGACPGVPYQAAGMQDLVTAVRSTGAKNVLMVGGVHQANDISHWLEYRPSDPDHNLVISWHAYNVNPCNDVACWQSTVAPAMQQVPLVAGEVGEYDCGRGFVQKLLPWLDQHGGGYLAWAWDAGPAWPCGSADASAGPSLITDYKGTPTQSYGQSVHDHFAMLGRGLTGIVPAMNPVQRGTSLPTRHEVLGVTMVGSDDGV